MEYGWLCHGSSSISGFTARSLSGQSGRPGYLEGQQVRRKVRTIQTMRRSNYEMKCNSPCFTTTCRIVKEIVALKSFWLHPIFIVVSGDTIQFVDQVRKPVHLVASICAPRVFSNWRCKWPMLGSPWEMDRPWKWCMGVVTFLKASGGLGCCLLNGPLLFFGPRSSNYWVTE